MFVRTSPLFNFGLNCDAKMAYRTSILAKFDVQSPVLVEVNWWNPPRWSELERSSTVTPKHCHHWYGDQILPICSVVEAFWEIPHQAALFAAHIWVRILSFASHPRSHRKSFVVVILRPIVIYLILVFVFAVFLDRIWDTILLDRFWIRLLCFLLIQFAQFFISRIGFRKKEPHTGNDIASDGSKACAWTPRKGTVEIPAKILRIHNKGTCLSDRHKPGHDKSEEVSDLFDLGGAAKADGTVSREQNRSNWDAIQRLHSTCLLEKSQWCATRPDLLQENEPRTASTRPSNNRGKLPWSPKQIPIRL